MGPHLKHYRLGLGGLLVRLCLSFVVAMATGTALFAKDTAAPASNPTLIVGVLVDTSAHQKKVIEFERQAVDSIAGQFGDGVSEAFLFTYSDRLDLLQDWSQLATGLKTASQQIHLSGDGGKKERTLLYDGINAALLRIGARPEPATRVLIVIGEGNDSGSSVKYSQIKKLARSQNVQCFALLVADHNLMGGRVRHFGWDLYDLASATHGSGYDIENSPRQLEKALKKILKKLHQNPLTKP